MKHETREWIDKVEAVCPRRGPFGMAARYPGVQADQRAADEAMVTAEEMRSVMRAKMELA